MANTNVYNILRENKSISEDRCICLLWNDDILVAQFEKPIHSAEFLGIDDDNLDKESRYQPGDEKMMREHFRKLQQNRVLEMRF